MTAWADEQGIAAQARDGSGVDNVEVNFCPGQGWLALRFKFGDLDSLIGHADAAEEVRR